MRFKLDGVGGPSAGLMFTGYLRSVSGQDSRLAVKLLNPGTKRTGLSVISVGPPRVKSAADSGTDIFFVPNIGCKEMKKADPDAKTIIKRLRKLLKKLGTKMKEPVSC